jgi:hypothetical protein
MPKAAHRTSGPNVAPNRKEPYPKLPPKDQRAADIKNVDPRSRPASTPKVKVTTDKGDWRNIPLDEVKGEMPCYDNAATVRRKLGRLLFDKSTIPDTDKSWSQAFMAAEMQELENHGPPVVYNRNASGPSPRSLSKFLKTSGQMGAEDSPCYNWGYVMLEKLRIYNGGKKSKSRLEAEEK